MPKATKEVVEASEPIPPGRRPSSQTEAWARICLAIEQMAQNAEKSLKAIEGIARNTSDMADELSELKAHLVGPGGD